jgi:hypothetical protein
MRLPPPQHSLVTLIDEHHVKAAGMPRPHLGASVLGHHCDRWLWLSFRWAVIEHHSGRMLRLFRRGQNEEETILSDLRAVGVTIEDMQTRLSFGGHVAGSLDAIVRGVPEAPDKPHVAEFKTHSAKSFSALENEGVQKSKPMHWVQMQLYMHATQIDRALYVAVCKDTDHYYVERIKYERQAAEEAVERGRRISESDRMPEPVAGASPAWWQCKMCPANHFCHNTNLTSEVNCRTCAHSTARDDGTWHCAKWDATIPTQAQREGCPSHVIHPDLAPWPLTASEDGASAIYTINNAPVVNGDGGVSSVDLINQHWAPF